MNLSLSNYRQQRAAVFDWATFILSLSLSLVFPTLRDMTNPAVYSPFLFYSMLLYTLGALVKDLTLRDRLQRERRPPAAIGYMIFLMVGHWFIFLLALVLSDPYIRQLLGYSQNPDRILTEYGGLYLLIPALITWLVFKPKSRPVRWFRFSSGMSAFGEGVADLLLLLGVGGLSFLFWEQGVMGMMGASELPNVGTVLFWVALLTFCYILFYLPLRYLFLVDERSSGHRFQRLLAIFGILSLRFLVEALGRI